MVKARHRLFDNLKRNVFSYKYLKHNILMTSLVVGIALAVLFIISFGEKADPLANELYQNEVVEVSQSSAVMMSAGSLDYVREAIAPSTTAVAAKETSVVTGSKKSYKVTVSVDGVMVREEGSREADIIDMAGYGEEFTVLEKGDSWIKIQYNDYTEGYVSADCVKLTEVK